MTYALILSGTITAEGRLPKSAQKVGTGQWVTPPDGVWSDAQAATCGWLPVVDATRPVDTATKTSDRTLTIVAGKPTVTWTVRDWTADELKGEQTQAAQATLDAAVLTAAAESSPTVKSALEALQILKSPPKGAEWRPAGEATTAYTLGWTVTRLGKLWESLIPNNVTMPGDPADGQSYRWWKDLTVAPTGAWDGNGHVYKVGDPNVTYLGKTYKVLQSHTSQPGWTPVAVPSLWALVP